MFLPYSSILARRCDRPTTRRCEREAAPPPKPLRLQRSRKSPTDRSLCDMRPCQQPPDPEAPWIASEYVSPAPRSGRSSQRERISTVHNTKSQEAAPFKPSSKQCVKPTDPVRRQTDLCQVRPLSSHPVPCAYTAFAHERLPRQDMMSEAALYLLLPQINQDQDRITGEADKRPRRLSAMELYEKPSQDPKKVNMQTLRSRNPWREARPRALSSLTDASKRRRLSSPRQRTGVKGMVSQLYHACPGRLAW